MELRDLFEGSLGEHLPAALAWCEAQRVTTAADIAEAGLSEDFARDVLESGGQATALQRSLLRKRLGTLEAGLEAKRARRLSALSTSDAEASGAGSSSSQPGPGADPAAPAGGELKQKGSTLPPAPNRPYKAFTAVCGVSARLWNAEAGGSRLVCDKVCRGTEQRVADHACSTHRSACKSFLSHHLHAPACHVCTEPQSSKVFKFFIDDADGGTPYCAKGGLSHANTPHALGTDMEPFVGGPSRLGDDSEMGSSSGTPDTGGGESERKRRLPPHAEACRRPFGYGLGYCNAANQATCIRSADCKCYLDTEPDPYRRSKLVCICPIDMLAAGFARARREHQAAMNEYKLARIAPHSSPRSAASSLGPPHSGPLRPCLLAPSGAQPAGGPIVLVPQPAFFPHYGPSVMAVPTGQVRAMRNDGQIVPIPGGAAMRGWNGHLLPMGGGTAMRGDGHLVPMGGGAAMRGGDGHLVPLASAAAMRGGEGHLVLMGSGAARRGGLAGNPGLRCNPSPHHPVEHHPMGPRPPQLQYSPPQPYPSAWHAPDGSCRPPHPGNDPRY